MPKDFAVDLPPGIQRVAMGVAYDGSAFYGWQTQPDGKTVQDTLEVALARFVTHPVATICAGRTDTGVHAVHQVVHFDVDCDRKESSWIRGVNTFLPDSVSVRWVRKVDGNFHARFSALSRTYWYWIYNDPVRSPMFSRRAGWVFRPLDIELMRQAAQCLLGEHDFTSFRAADCQAATPVRTISSLNVIRKDSLVGIEITANAFLQHMVRNIVGSLVYVGMGRKSVSWLSDVLQAKDRSLAAPTFDPCGLYFAGVRYPESFAIPDTSPIPF